MAASANAKSVTLRIEPAYMRPLIGTLVRAAHNGVMSQDTWVCTTVEENDRYMRPVSFQGHRYTLNSSAILHHKGYL